MVDTGMPTSRRLLNSTSSSTVDSSKSSTHEPEPEESESGPHGSRGKGAHKTWHLFPTKHAQSHPKGARKKKGQQPIEQKHSHK